MILFRKDSRKGRLEKIKKVLISIIPVIVIIAILITGKKYWNEYQVKKDAD